VFLLIAHVRVDPGEAPERALTDAQAPVRLLAAQPDTRRLCWARSTEDARRLVLTAEFDSAAGYRRALSPFDVRTIVVPWLSRADVVARVHEVLLAADHGAVQEPEITVPDPDR
jgi:hypothetical protein